MRNNVLLGIWRFILPVPENIWQSQVGGSSSHNRETLAALPADHQRVRNFVVRELPRLNQPMHPDLIARELSLPLEKVSAILEDLEERMSFLYRAGTDSVVWAYPVTVAQTPHRATLSTGESIHAA